MYSNGFPVGTNCSSDSPDDGVERGMGVLGKGWRLNLLAPATNVEAPPLRNACEGDPLRRPTESSRSGLPKERALGRLPDLLMRRRVVDVAAEVESGWQARPRCQT